MGRHGRQGFNRRRTLLEVGVAWLVLCGLGLIVSAVALLFYASDVRAHQLAVALQAGGTRVIASPVEVLTESQSKGGDIVAAVRVTFPVPQGGKVRAELTGIGEEGPNVELGWGPPRAGSHYAAPLEVFYLPTDPQQAMTRLDIEEYRYDDVAETRTVVALGILPSGLTALAWWARRFSRRKRGPEPEKGNTSADV